MPRIERRRTRPGAVTAVRGGGLLLVCLGLAGCGPGPVAGCENAAGIEVDCRFQNPEDLARFPDGRILVSQFGGLDGARPGQLALYAPAERTLSVAFPTGEHRAAASTEWGEPDCPFPDEDAFSPHGIDVNQRLDRRHQLAVVNHGGRESVELFEVFEDGTMTWMGCVLAPEDSTLNDVVLLRDGGFWVTHMAPRSSLAWSFWKAYLFGANTGWVYAWRPGEGLSKLDGTDTPMPNGVEKTDDERYVFVNVYSPMGVWKINARNGDLALTWRIATPDNSTWAEDGRLLVASQTGGIGALLRCAALDAGATCGAPFEIVAMSPNRYEEQVLVANEGAPMGGASVALQQDGVLYLGGFASDRLGIVDLSE